MKACTLIKHFCVLAALLPGFAVAQLPSRTGGKDAPNKSKDWQRAAAKKMDLIVGGAFRKTGVRPLKRTTDEQFVRRIYLNVAGRIPTHGEATSFLADTDKDKRAKLIDELLDSDAYVSHFFNWWADLLRASDNFAQTSGAPYIHWIKDNLAQNTPYDEMVHHLLTATGGGWEEGNGAVGYYVRDKGMPLDNMANTTRIFLGTRIECAQCHNHPFDDWKQMDFYEMAAFTTGVKSVNSSVARQVNSSEDSQPRELRNIARMVRYAVYDFSIADSGGGTIKLPYDYQYRDADPGEPVDAKYMFGKKPKVSSKLSSRDKFAAWLTSPDNPRFTHVITNRLFKRVMSVGQFEPVDNFSDASKPSNPELMNFLIQTMKDLEYDMKAFQRVLYNTYTYQLSANPKQHSGREPYHFEGRQLRRMSAEQIWDSLLTLSIDKVDTRKKVNYTGDIYYNGRPVLVGKKSMHQLYQEVSAIKSGDEFWGYCRKLLNEIKSDKGGGKRKGGGGMMMTSARSYGGKMRASELRSPMPPGHFLRKFGQSDREVIQGANTESDVTQVLSIINGEVERELVNNGGAAVFKVINAAKTPEDKIEAIFMSVLTRAPSEDEMAIMLEEVKTNGDNAYKNILAALICTSEFMFVQ